MASRGFPLAKPVCASRLISRPSSNSAAHAISTPSAPSTWLKAMRCDRPPAILLVTSHSSVAPLEVSISGVQPVKPTVLLLKSAREIVEIARGFGRPCDFRQCAQARKGHVFHLLEIGNVFSPDIALRAEDVLVKLRREIRRDRLESIDLIQR